MDCSSWFVFKEFRPVWIAFLKSILSPEILEIVLEFFNTSVFSQKWVDLSCLSTLGIFDVSHVWTSSDKEATKDGK